MGKIHKASKSLDNQIELDVHQNRALYQRSPHDNRKSEDHVAGLNMTVFPNVHTNPGTPGSFAELAKLLSE